MARLKGITPIIAILVMLLITIAITGSAWIYIQTYYAGMTGKAIEVTSVDCTSTGGKIYIRNIGTDNLDSPTDVDVNDREIISGSCTGVLAITFNPTTIGPGQSTVATDAGCTSSDSATVRYTVVVGGRVQKVQLSC